ncbi:hypothetical protein JCM10449v2_002918 [Rhodotorula kratochvilovae]
MAPNDHEEPLLVSSILERAHAAVEMARGLGQRRPPFVVAPNTSAAVGLLANKHRGKVPEADNFEVLIHYLEATNRYGGARDRRYRGVFHNRIQHMGFEIAHDALCTMARPEVVADTSVQTLSLPVVLLYLLYDVANGLKRAHFENVTAPLQCALSALYAFSLYTFHPQNSSSAPAASFEWTHDAWWRYIGAFAARDDMHSRRYGDLVEMLAEGKMSSNILRQWALWLVQRPGYGRADGTPPLRAQLNVQQKMEEFVRTLVLTIVPGSIGTALETDHTVPVGLAVFHPDSQRRAPFPQTW